LNLVCNQTTENFSFTDLCQAIPPSSAPTAAASSG
jgi:hypothetical protein